MVNNSGHMEVCETGPNLYENLYLYANFEYKNIYIRYKGAEILTIELSIQNKSIDLEGEIDDKYLPRRRLKPNATLISHSNIMFYKLFLQIE